MYNFIRKSAPVGNLDVYVNLSRKKIFNRSSADYRDSGAITVGAGSSATPHTRLSFSHYGSRIDAYGWGETTTTDTAGTDNTLYTETFNGTPSATPTITGAALVVQALALINLGYKISPLQARQILKTNGTASSNPTFDLIGVLPNLKPITDESYLNLTPDLYIRDYVGDVDNTTASVVSASPDIIVRQNSVNNPQASFSVGSGNENNSALSRPVLAGCGQSIYIRVLNCGGSPATQGKEALMK